ncbi:hypothetical protein [Glutamicibacter sp.]|uniref:hypothetical protein n=1 Tax=Glutamicibacter sp. TaxID=1931995 RepID=UPI002B470BC6|nr:hypothetical protein [Glutamicibacter sp.]HJX80384.1 hypothetical protein [Glutamicibacter sp.]
MKSITDYLDELRFNLSLRNLDVTVIRDIVREVETESSNYDEATASFGTPNEYADSFPKEAAPKGQQAFMIIGVVLGILWPMVQLVLRERTAGSMSNWAVTWLPALGFVALGIIIDFSRAIARSRKSR